MNSTTLNQVIQRLVDEILLHPPSEHATATNSAVLACLLFGAAFMSVGWAEGGRRVRVVDDCLHGLNLISCSPATNITSPPPTQHTQLTISECGCLLRHLGFLYVLLKRLWNNSTVSYIICIIHSFIHILVNKLMNMLTNDIGTI